MSNNTSKIVTNCQICGQTPLESILFLGYLPPAEDFHSIGERPKEEQSYPAEILYCKNCHLVQSGLIVNQTVIFPKSYAYISSNTKLLRDNFAELYGEVSSMFGLKQEDLVVDIGSNDGNLLSNFKDKAKVLGVTPEDIGKIAIERGIPTLLDYFTKEIAEKIKKEYGTAKIITATNAFAHIDNVNDLVESILEVLQDDGLFITESHYLLQLIKMNQFDSVYHEHLRHYSLHSLKYLLETHGLQIIHAKQIPTHAGSIRVYAARKDKYPVQDTVPALLDEEKKTILSKEALDDFRKRTMLAKLDLVALLRDIKKRGGRVYGIGAPFRGTTLIKYVGIDEGIVDCVLEVQSSPKINKYIPGTLIPILEESKLYEDQPEYALLFSWQITDELVQKLKERGFRGDFIVPLPTPRIIKNK
ncbi:methyltransferase [Candidatus Jorgensenbacteria bacterium RIFCSPLOWO2_01_FULL_45_25b]|uniref:Methyltransferase n=1 Tax=Candidatus Jorgensenbacteria bacterium RIFCSPLOWO2_01_FULL_45_25b TaxID=1798471 RepID=A0A1F6BVG6_9BACT|nr:MAG: methyltransferase [Candidatus Jorgensenbacteria bacterium RIFCSPLOWO2_01_FULL_45_25b]